jgi:hypothetical protein
MDERREMFSAFSGNLLRMRYREASFSLSIESEGWLLEITPLYIQPCLFFLLELYT